MNSAHQFGHKVNPSNNHNVYLALHVIVYVALFRVISYYITPRISSLLSRRYARTVVGDLQIRWRSFANSTLHATIIFFWAIYMMLTDEGMRLENRKYPGTLNFQKAMTFTVAYFLYDIIQLVRYPKLFGSKLELLHHAISLAGSGYVCLTANYSYWADFQLLHEFSTPFINMRWFILTVKIGKERKRYKIVCFCALIAFFLCRIVTMPYFWWTLFTQCLMINDSVCSNNRGSSVLLVVLMCCLDFVNLYWFSRMVKMLQRAIQDTFTELHHRREERSLSVYVSEAESHAESDKSDDEEDTAKAK